MSRVPSLSDLEDHLAAARDSAPGTPTELAAVVELASRLVSDPQRRGELARAGADLAARLGDEAARLRCCAMVAESVGRHDGSAEALPDALTTLAQAERLGDPLALAQAHHTVARCYHALDCPSEAFDHTQAALARYREVSDRFGEGRVLSLAAALYADLHEPARGRRLYEQAHDIFVECDDPSGAGVMLAGQAKLLRESGDLAAAAGRCEAALERFAEADMPLDSLIAMREYAHVMAALGEHDLAALWAKRALERNRLPDGSIANRNYEVDLLHTLATAVHVPRGELDAARSALEKAVALAAELDARADGAGVEETLAEVLYAGGDHAGAYDRLKHSRVLADEVARAAEDQRIRALRVRFEIEQAQREALHYREQARAQAEVIVELERTKTELADRMDELQRLHDEIVQLSQTDPLTGIANRRRMNETLVDLALAGAASGTPLAVAVFDIDRFKAINDRYGHDVGDTVLREFVRLLRAHLRPIDLPARLGGDEFVAVMPGLSRAEAVLTCRKLLIAVRRYPWRDTAPGLSVTVTIGVAESTGEVDADEILRRADAALYRGKNAGRDGVAV